MNKPTAVDLIAMIVDRDTPPDLDGDEVVDWDITGKPITRRMVREFAKAKASIGTAPAQVDVSPARASGLKGLLRQASHVRDGEY